MTDKTMKPGRPSAGSSKETVKVVHVALDEGAHQALQRLVERVARAQPRGATKRGHVSIAVREAIYAADAAAKK